MVLTKPSAAEEMCCPPAKLAAWERCNSQNELALLMTMLPRYTLVLGILFAGLSVVIGAFGAHALKGILEVHNRTDVFETGVKYMMFHALGLIMLGIWDQGARTAAARKAAKYVTILFVAGILLFSGSLFALALLNNSKLGMITPFGGAMFIFGWIAWGVVAYNDYVVPPIE